MILLKWSWGGSFWDHPRLPIPTPERALMKNLPAKIVGTIIAKKERGATAVEYGIMVALIAAVIITAVTLLGTNLTSLFNTVAGKV